MSVKLAHEVVADGDYLTDDTKLVCVVMVTAQGAYVEDAAIPCGVDDKPLLIRHRELARHWRKVERE